MALLSLLASVSPGVLITGVISLFEALLPFPSAIVAALLICITPAGTGLATVMAKATEPEAPAARGPISNVQLVPAGLPSAQLQPPELEPALNVVLAGTVSSITTLARPMLPVFA